MIMWIVGLVLMAVTIVVGYRQGAIRSAFSFIGLVVAAAMAIPLGPLFGWVFPLIGFKNSLAPKFGGPIIAFFIVSFVFKAFAAFVHRKVDYHYRYNRADAERAVWEVMHRRVGACIGAMNGVVYFFVFAIVVAVFGYVAIQTGNDNNSKVLTFLGKAANDLQATHMDKVVAAFNPAPPKYFDASDTLGLLYHNRKLIDRLENYPVFAAMAEEPIYQSLGKDKELQTLIRGNSSIGEILENPKVQEVITNSDIVTRVMDIDLMDLKQYLETGVSPKFEKEKILGRWSYDVLATLQLNKSLKPDVAASTWFHLKNELTERFNNSLFTAFFNEKATFNLTTNMEAKASPFDPAPPVRLPNGQFRTNYVARWLTTNASYSATGKWSGSAPDYLITLGNKNGTATSEGKLQDGRLSFQFEGKPLSFTHLAD